MTKIKILQMLLKTLFSFDICNWTDYMNEKQCGKLKDPVICPAILSPYFCVPFLFLTTDKTISVLVPS